MKRYENQSTRGKLGYGYYDVQTQTIFKHPELEPIETKLKSYKEGEASDILFHHRMPTSTRNVQNAAHPFTTGSFFRGHAYVLAHNGQIHNSKELKLEHEKLGIKYTSVQEDGKFNDSESLLWEMALVLEGRKKAPATKGGAAFIIIKNRRIKGQEVEPVSVNFGCNKWYPLKMIFSDTDLVLASQEDWVLGDMTTVPNNLLHSYYYRDGSMQIRPMTFELSERRLQKASNPYVKGPYTDGSYAAEHNVTPGGYRSHLAEGEWNSEEKRWEMRSGYYKHGSWHPWVHTTARVLTTVDRENKVTEYIQGLVEKYDGDDSEINYRISKDFKQASAAVKQLGQKMKEDGGLRNRSARKYDKYFTFLQVITRAKERLSIMAEALDD